MRLNFVLLRLEPSNRRGRAARFIQFPSTKSRIIFFWQTIQFRNSSGLDCLFFPSVFCRRASFLNASNASCIAASRSAGNPGVLFALFMTLRQPVFCQVLFPEKSVGIPFFQQGIFPAFSGHYASLRMRACSIR